MKKYPDHDVYSSSYKTFKARCVKKLENIQFQDQQFISISDFFLFNKFSSSLNCSNILIQTVSLKKIGVFNENYTHYEDIDWFIRIGIYGKTAMSKYVTVFIDETAANRSDHVSMNKRNLPDFTKYRKWSSNHIGLSQYLNLNLFFICMDFKIAGLTASFTHYKNLIDLNHLSWKQNRLLKAPSWLLKKMKSIKELLSCVGINLRTN